MAGQVKFCVASISQSKTVDCSFLTCFFLYYIIVLLEKAQHNQNSFAQHFRQRCRLHLFAFCLYMLLASCHFVLEPEDTYVCLYVDELSLKMCVNRSLKWLVRNRDCTFNIIKISNINTVSTRQCLQIFRH